MRIPISTRSPNFKLRFTFALQCFARLLRTGLNSKINMRLRRSSPWNESYQPIFVVNVRQRKCLVCSHLYKITKFQTQIYVLVAKFNEGKLCVQCTFIEISFEAKRTGKETSCTIFFALIDNHFIPGILIHIHFQGNCLMCCTHDYPN